MRCPFKYCCYKNAMESWVHFLETMKSNFQLTINFCIFHGDLVFLSSLISFFPSFETSNCYVASYSVKPILTN